MMDLEGYEILNIFGLEGKLVPFSELNKYFYDVLTYGNLKWDFSIHKDKYYIVAHAEKQESNVNNEEPNSLVKWVEFTRDFYFSFLAKQTHMLISEKETRCEFRKIFATNENEAYYEIEEHNGTLYTNIYVPKNKMIYDYAHLGIPVVVYLKNELYHQMMADVRYLSQLLYN